MDGVVKVLYIFKFMSTPKILFTIIPLNYLNLRKIVWWLSWGNNAMDIILY